MEMLLVEDDPADVRLVREALKCSSITFQLRVARDGEQALAILRREDGHAAAPTPDLVLLDVQLPKMDGFAVLNELKQDAALKCIPVVMLSTSSALAAIQQCYDLGANAYVVKPQDFAHLVTAIRSIADFWCMWAALPCVPGSSA